MGGSIPPWLFERMTRLSRAIVEAILVERGSLDFLARISDPFWFQSFGNVIGMDWNSSGVTTSITAALKRSINPYSRELGLYVCGGKGKDSLKTPAELVLVGDKTGLDGNLLARSSKLSAKVDNTAVQDGYQLYLHSFIVNEKGDWSVIQQGMKPAQSSARRYHWHSAHIQSFVEEPHAAICGENQGEIFNMVDKLALPAQASILELTREKPAHVMHGLRHLTMPTYRQVTTKDIDLKRLGGILQIAHEAQTTQFEDLLLLQGLGPRTLQSLALVSEVIYGTPSRFQDPARFSFAHGGKGGSPFPVPTHVYDETIATLTSAVEKAKIGQSDKTEAIKKLSLMAQKAENEQKNLPDLHDLIEKEKQDAWKYGGRTIRGISKPKSGQQLDLFE